jgi:hypothetical protein
MRRLPIAPVLLIAMVEISARPNISSTMTLHQLREDAEGGVDVFYCSAGVRFVALRFISRRRNILSAFGSQLNRSMQHRR